MERSWGEWSFQVLYKNFLMDAKAHSSPFISSNFWYYTFPTSLLFLLSVVLLLVPFLFEGSKFPKVEVGGLDIPDLFSLIVFVLLSFVIAVCYFHPLLIFIILWVHSSLLNSPHLVPRERIENATKVALETVHEVSIEALMAEAKLMGSAAWLYAPLRQRYPDIDPNEEEEQKKEEEDEFYDGEEPLSAIATENMRKNSLLPGQNDEGEKMEEEERNSNPPSSVSWLENVMGGNIEMKHSENGESLKTTTSPPSSSVDEDSDDLEEEDLVVLVSEVFTNIYLCLSI